MSKWLAFPLVLLLLVLIGCGSNFKKDAQSLDQQDKVLIDEKYFWVDTALPPADYVAWLRRPQNGLLSKFSEGNLSYGLQYTPIDLVALRHLDPSPSKESFEKEKSSIDGSQYFTFTVATISGEDITTYRTSSDKDKEIRSQYYSYDMQRDLRLVDGSDTLPCVMFHHEMTFGVSPHTNFLLGFELTKKTKEALSSGKQIEYSDKTLIFKNRMDGMAQIALTIKAAALAQIPKLIIE